MACQFHCKTRDLVNTALTACDGDRQMSACLCSEAALLSKTGFIISNVALFRCYSLSLGNLAGPNLCTGRSKECAISTLNARVTDQKV